MSERIQELAIQAGGIWRGGYVGHPNGDLVWSDQKWVDPAEMDVSTFAELIVRECMGVAASQRDPANLNYKPSERFVEALKMHFGVKK